MKITTKVRYGLRAMIQIAETESQSPVNITTLCEDQNLSVKYLEALMVKLRNAGLLNSIRGKNGGYLLAKDPKDITAYDIFMALDEDFDIVPCLCSDNICDREEFCGSADLWKDLSDSIKSKLKNIKLENLKSKVLKGV